MASIDIGAAANFVTRREGWWKTCLVVGLCSLIPVVGPIVLFGWQRRAFEAALRGDPLPDLDFGADVSGGFGVFVAIFTTVFPLVFLIFGVIFLGAVPGALTANTDAAQVGSVLSAVIVSFGWLFATFAILAINVLMPEVQRSAFRGSYVPILSPLAIGRRIMARPGDYAMTWVGLFLANMVSSLGAMFCYVGLFVTMPAGMAMIAHLLAQWDQAGPAEVVEG